MAEGCNKMADYQEMSWNARCCAAGTADCDEGCCPLCRVWHALQQWLVNFYGIWESQHIVCRCEAGKSGRCDVIYFTPFWVTFGRSLIHNCYRTQWTDRVQTVCIHDAHFSLLLLSFFAPHSFFLHSPIYTHSPSPIPNQILHPSAPLAIAVTALVHPIPDWPRGRRLFYSSFSCFMENYSIRKPYLDPGRKYRVCERL